jgi:hypothetical protein
MQPKRGMQEFLGHVVRTVPYYRRLGGERGSRLSLDDFPVVTRDMVAADPAAFRSSTFEPDARILFADTNGTVRRKLRVVFDLTAWFDFNCGSYARIAQRVPGLADRLSPGSLAILLVADNPAARPMTLVMPTLSGALLRQIVIGKDVECDRSEVGNLGVSAPDVLYGKPSNLVELAALGRRYGVPGIRPFAVLTSGENLYEDDRRRLEDAFQAPVFNAYVATEGGLIGMECEYHTGLHIEEDRVHVEVVGADGAISRQGLGEVLLTNVMNWAHAFVRYQLGDTALVERSRCRCGHEGLTIARLWGGDVRCYSTVAGPVDADSVTQIVVGKGIPQFQLCQLSPSHFRIMWVPAAADVPRLITMHRGLCEALTRRFPRVTFELTPVGHIKARGGKTRRFPMSLGPPTTDV